MSGRLILRIECVDDDAVAVNKVLAKVSRQERSSYLDRLPMRRRLHLQMAGKTGPWVAEITAVGKTGVLERRFVKGLKDYTHANSVGSRGVYMQFILTPGIYEIFDHPKRGQTRHRFARLADGKIREITRAEALTWLASATSTSTY